MGCVHRQIILNGENSPKNSSSFIDNKSCISYVTLHYFLVFANKLPADILCPLFLHKVGGEVKKVDPTNGWSVFSHENDRLSMID